MSEISYMPFKPGMSIKSGDSVFVFVDGVSVETFQKDEDFRSGTITTVVAGKVRIEWDGTVSTDSRRFGAKEYVYVDKSRLTRIERGTWVLDHKSETSDVSESTEKVETPETPAESEKAEVPAPRRSRGKSANA